MLISGVAETFKTSYTVTADDVASGFVVDIAIASRVNSYENAVTGSGVAEVEVGAETTESVKTGVLIQIALMISPMILFIAFYVNALFDRRRRRYR